MSDVVIGWLCSICGGRVSVPSSYYEGLPIPTCMSCGNIQYEYKSNNTVYTNIKKDGPMTKEIQEVKERISKKIKILENQISKLNEINDIIDSLPKETIERYNELLM